MSQWLPVARNQLKSYKLYKVQVWGISFDEIGFSPKVQLLILQIGTAGTFVCWNIKTIPNWFEKHFCQDARGVRVYFQTAKRGSNRAGFSVPSEGGNLQVCTPAINQLCFPEGKRSWLTALQCLSLQPVMMNLSLSAIVPYFRYWPWHDFYYQR